MRLAILTLALTTTALGQPNTCGGLKTVTDTTPLIYPPIARAAHLGGIVTLQVTFKTNGDVENISVINGHPMLLASSKAFVQGWHANAFSGQRNCPIVIRYQLVQDIDKETITRDDPQHVTITSRMPVTDYQYATAPK